MSSSEPKPVRMQATPWALDELELPEIFTPLNLGGQPANARASQQDGNEDAEMASPQERARIEAAAYARGRGDGERLARAEVVPKLESAIAALGEALESISVHQARWMGNIEENIAVVAVVAARHLIAREVEADASVVSGLVQRALAQFPLDHAITVRLNPDDVQACNESLMNSSSRRVNDVRLTADPLIQRGGCMVEGRERIIDGRVDTALERVYRLLGNVHA